ncbi:putative peroxisome assembly protein [Leptomonas pyrrhocoris]|uniref:Peroxisomal ATPase PEX6 n=1 Tax=Leptomonas pyrrhocoris TaxID=157538 RepID=A0A0N1J4K5_LEPPY|nr:putative peroxisome assembly protein [Leptomonas pyrrhocoris]XP_015656198.1 putative peroxisome assembly protein [Leptomonas pyrrhocoris]XP_015656199.1 putative peroxisome assembly protein [Leptomonas pyrrhocoris]KPA77758.1 putative peroxisome assembly protein [Leptomonas pyrrhocoris]KPA77759.1 putative peroxisome assembly protein [Leptomonas pyrrhocoris]KPA77760.1 putative peroxisome assembly protein [Leptomonas pyrrhocoris]|eukprot:XP_015656197.1 putative peroxisome assembly protein [Leptomonas pyrrhocoris]
MSSTASAPLVRCLLRALTDDGYKNIMDKPPGEFSLQSEISKLHPTLSLHQVLPGTAAYPSLRVVDLIPATRCSLKADDAVTMVVLPPVRDTADQLTSADAGEQEEAAGTEEGTTCTIAVRLNTSLRGSTALASQGVLDALLIEDECVVKVCGSQHDCVFVVEKVSDPPCGASPHALEVGPELFRNLRAAFYSRASQAMATGDNNASYADTVIDVPADVFTPLEDDEGELLLRSSATVRHRLEKIVLCPATGDTALTELYGLYYPELCAIFGAASAAAWEGQFVSTGDVLLLDDTAFTRAAHRLEGVDVLETVSRVLSHKVRSWRGSWTDEMGSSPQLLALRVVRTETDRGPVPFGVMHTNSSDDDPNAAEVVLVHQRNYKGNDLTPVWPPTPAEGLAGVEAFARIRDALRSAISPSLDVQLHTFVVHGVKENLARELVDCAVQQCGLASVLIAADGVEEAELEDAVRTFLSERCGGATVLVIHNAHVIASSCPHLLSLLDERISDDRCGRDGADPSGARVLFLLCESMEAVPPMIAARATNAEGVLECGNPSEEDRASFIAPVLEWCCQRHRVQASVLLTPKTFAGWTVGLTYADILSLVEECARAAAQALPALYNGDTSEARAVVSDVSCEPIVQSYLKAHGYNMVSTKLQPVRWSDVGGLEEAKRELRETIQLPLLHPELFESGMKKRTGVLFYGPPGCGKTLLAKAVATEMNMNFMSVKGPELINQYVGESEKNIRLLFQRARDNSPCIVFFDELDALAPARGAKGDAGGVMDRIVSQLMVEVDGVGQKRSDGTASGDVFIIGATNRPDLLDAALLRPGRFDRLCYLGIPSTRAEQLFALRALTRKFDMHDDVSLEAVLEPLDFVYTGADFFALCSDAMMFAVEDALEAVQEQLTAAALESKADDGAATVTAAEEEESKPIKVCMEHFLRARSQLKPSVTKADLHKYEALKKKFDK